MVKKINQATQTTGALLLPLPLPLACRPLFPFSSWEVRLSSEKSCTSNDGEGWALDDDDVYPLDDDVSRPLGGDVADTSPFVRDFLWERMTWRSEEPQSSWEVERGNSTGIGVYDLETGEEQQLNIFKVCFFLKLMVDDNPKRWYIWWWSTCPWRNSCSRNKTLPSFGLRIILKKSCT